MRLSDPRVTMDDMETPHTEWITVAAYENLPGRPAPRSAARA